MTRKYIGRILVLSIAVLSIAACAQSPSPNRDEVAVGKKDCYWNKPAVPSDTRLVCTTAVQIVNIDTSGVGDSTKSGP